MDTGNMRRLLSYGVRRCRAEVFRRFFRETNHDLRNTVLVAGAPRSGTTWIAELLSSAAPTRLMFEPFNPDLVKAFAAFNHFQYMCPEKSSPELYRFSARVFRGDIRNAWIDRQIDTLRPSRRVVKDVRTNLMLGWLHHQFPEVPIILIVRHPCAVVASRLKLGWATDEDIERLVSQSDLLEDYLESKMEVIASAQSAAEKHAVIWCVFNLVPLRQLAGLPQNVFFYEALKSDPAIELPRLFEAAGLPYSNSALAAATRASMTSRQSEAPLVDEQIPRWRSELSAPQIAGIQRIVDAFGLSDLYPAGRVSTAGAASIALSR
jgi:hypothetical protein